MKSSITFQNQSVIELRQGNSRALFCPQHGARLLLWEVEQKPIVFWPESADWSKPAKIRGGNPILFPFVARHFVDGVMEKWRSADGAIHDMPTHGFCREASFQEIPDGESSVRMRLQESPATSAFYPFCFQFDVIYRLTENSLSVEFAVTNTGDKPLPYYAGHHFYFALPHLERADWQMETPFARVGRQTPDGSIAESVNTLTHTTLDHPEIIDQFWIEPKLPGFSLKNQVKGRALVFELDVAQSVPWYSVTTWTEKPESDFYCVEPWLGLPNAIGHQLGLRWIAPGQVERSICRLVSE